MSIFDFFKRKRASVKQPDASKDASKQTSVASPTTEPTSISNSVANVQEVEINIAKSQEVSASSEQDNVVNSEVSEQEAKSDITAPQKEAKKYFSKTLDFGEYEYGTIEFVDLGLSSGTLWSTRNSGAQHVYDPGYEATMADEFELLPTYEQCEEFIKECNFAVALLQEGDNTFGCVSATGPNGNVIYLPLHDSEEFGCLAFDCWTRSDFGGSMGAFMLIQTEPLFGPFFNLSNITIGVSQKSVYRRWRFVTSR